MLLVEDIVDIGYILIKVIEYLFICGFVWMKIIVLFDKFVWCEVLFKVDWIGFEIFDEFVVGYGIDFV